MSKKANRKPRPALRKPRVMYLLQGVIEAVDVAVQIETDSGVETLQLQASLDFADGMIGAMPVFETREQAAAYGGEGAEIRAIYRTGELIVPGGAGE